jgi:hypothetical protein
MKNEVGLPFREGNRLAPEQVRPQPAARTRASARDSVGEGRAVVEERTVATHERPLTIGSSAGYDRVRMFGGVAE